MESVESFVVKFKKKNGEGECDGRHRRSNKGLDNGRQYQHGEPSKKKKSRRLTLSLP